jgi:hypothetical protein
MVTEQYAIHRLRGDRQALIVILQSDAAETQNTRIVAPLLDTTRIPSLGKLNPHVVFASRRMEISVDQLASIPTRLIGEKAGSCAELRYEITRALDMLFQGS